jgi:hypothetical protein
MAVGSCSAFFVRYSGCALFCLVPEVPEGDKAERERGLTAIFKPEKVGIHMNLTFLLSFFLFPGCLVPRDCFFILVCRFDV